MDEVRKGILHSSIIVIHILIVAELCWSTARCTDVYISDDCIGGFADRLTATPPGPDVAQSAQSAQPVVIQRKRKMNTSDGSKVVASKFVFYLLNISWTFPLTDAHWFGPNGLLVHNLRFAKKFVPAVFRLLWPRVILTFRPRNLQQWWVKVVITVLYYETILNLCIKVSRLCKFQLSKDVISFGV